MALSSVQPLLQNSPYGCQWTDPASGAKCGRSKILARALCSRHYRQLQRSGALANLTTKPTEPEDITFNLESLTLAKDRLTRLAPFAARKLREAIEVSAARGDSKPIEWLLLHSGVVKTPEKIPSASVSPLTIKIGVALAGVSSETSRTLPTIRVSSESLQAQAPSESISED